MRRHITKAKIKSNQQTNIQTGVKVNWFSNLFLSVELKLFLNV